MLELYKILDSYGWKGVVLALCIFVIYKVMNGGIATISERIKLKFAEKRQARLSIHAFFNSIDYILNTEVSALDVPEGKPVRQALTRDLVFASLTAVKEIAHKIVEMPQSDWTKAEWTFHMQAMLNEMNTLFLSKCTAKGIPHVVYTKYMEWYFIRLNHMRSLVDQIAASELSSTPENKTSTLLMLFSLFIITMMGDCESAMNELNGDLTGIAYNGGVIEPLNDH